MSWDDIPDLGGRVEPATVVPVLDLGSPTATGYASERVSDPPADSLGGPVADPLDGTPFARVRIPPGVTGFGFGELRLLLAGQDTPASRATAVVLGFDQPLDAPEILAAAASSLLGRGLMAVDAAGAFRTAGEAALTESLFATAFRWTTVTFRVDERADLLVLIEAEGQVGLLQARQYGTWFVALPGAVADPATLAANAMSAMVSLYGSGTFAVEVQSLGGSRGPVYLSRSAGGEWVARRALESEEVLAQGSVPDLVRWALDEPTEASA